MFDTVWLLATMLLIASPLLLPFLKDGVLDGRSFLISGGMAVFALCMPFFGFGSASVVSKFLFAQTLLFASFVCISRLRQRKSLFLQTVASVGSNGGWYIALQVLAISYISAQTSPSARLTVGLLVAAVAGTVIGRLVGVQWTVYIEKKFQVQTDSVGSENLKWLDARTFNGLFFVVAGCILWYALFSQTVLRDVLVVMVLGLMQSVSYSVNSRLGNRGHPGWATVVGFVAGITFAAHAAFLIGYTSTGEMLPLHLLIPYTVATVAGGTWGSQISMRIEKTFNIGSPDAHVLAAKKGEKVDPYGDVTWHKKFLWVTGILCGVYLLFSQQILQFFGLTSHVIVLPFISVGDAWYGRSLGLLVAGTLFAIGGTTHGMSSRAGNRNNASFHAVTCVLHGIVAFGTSSFQIFNAHFADLIPVMAFGSALTALLVQQWSMKIEVKLRSVMDPPKEKESVPRVA